MKKFLISLAVLTALVTPAFAHPDNGTGNVLSFSHKSTAPHKVITARRPNGLHSFAMVPGPGPVFNSDGPEATGGGSLGYNELLRTY
jgi:hypothetical protein